jgi:hypothetical protein
MDLGSQDCIIGVKWLRQFCLQPDPEITDMIHPTQMGGRSQKSAIDASLLLYNYVQEQRKRGLVTSTVFVDVKGAFDHVQARQASLQSLSLPPCPGSSGEL